MAPANLVPGEVPRSDSQTALFSLCTHMAEGTRELSGVSFTRVLNSIHGTSTLMTSSLQEAHLPILSHWKLDSQHMDFGGGGRGTHTLSS